MLFVLTLFGLFPTKNAITLNLYFAIYFAHEYSRLLKTVPFLSLWWCQLRLAAVGVSLVSLQQLNGSLKGQCHEKSCLAEALWRWFRP